MTAKAADKLKSDGWKIVETSGFLHPTDPEAAQQSGGPDA